VLVCLNHVARFIVNANHSFVLPAAMLRVADCVRDCIPFAVPEPTEWHRKRAFLDCSVMNGSVEQRDLKAEQVQRTVV